MTQTVPSDIITSVTPSLTETLFIAALGCAAMAYLLHRFIKKGRRTLLGDGCGDCAGCGTQGGACHSAATHVVCPEYRAENK